MLKLLLNSLVAVELVFSSIQNGDDLSRGAANNVVQFREDHDLLFFLFSTLWWSTWNPEWHSNLDSACWCNEFTKREIFSALLIRNIASFKDETP